MYYVLTFVALAGLLTQSFATPVPNQDEQLVGASYDYVVVGGGEQ